MALQVRVAEVSLVAEHLIPKLKPNTIYENGTENGNGILQFSCPLVLFRQSHVTNGNVC